MVVAVCCSVLLCVVFHSGVWVAVTATGQRVESEHGPVCRVSHMQSVKHSQCETFGRCVESEKIIQYHAAEYIRLSDTLHMRLSDTLHTLVQRAGTVHSTVL